MFPSSNHVDSSCFAIAVAMVCTPIQPFHRHAVRCYVVSKIQTADNWVPVTNWSYLAVEIVVLVVNTVNNENAIRMTDFFGSLIYLYSKYALAER